MKWFSESCEVYRYALQCCNSLTPGFKVGNRKITTKHLAIWVLLVVFISMTERNGAVPVDRIDGLWPKNIIGWHKDFRKPIRDFFESLGMVVWVDNTFTKNSACKFRLINLPEQTISQGITLTRWKKFPSNSQIVASLKEKQQRIKDRNPGEYHG